MGYSKHKVEHIIQKTPSLSTDASGNTVLVGAGGEVIPLNGSITSIAAQESISFFASLKTSVKPEYGPAISHARTTDTANATTVEDCYGTLQFVDTNEVRFMGAHRVKNLLTAGNTEYVNTGSSWVVGANVSSTLMPMEVGPIAGALNVSKVARTSGTGYAYFAATTVRAGYHMVSAYFKASGGDTGDWKLKLYQTASPYLAAEVTFTPTGDWQRIAVPLLVTTPGTYQVQIIPVNTVSEVLVSSIQLEWTNNRTVPSDYVSAGAIEGPYYHGAKVDGVKYFDYYSPWTVATGGGVATRGGEVAIPDSILHGMLVEPLTWNRATYSDDPSNAAWTKTNLGTPTKDYSTQCPTGYGNLWKLPETVDTGEHSVSQVIGTAAITNQQHCVSVYAKAAERSWLRLSILKRDGVSYAHAWFDLVNGVVGTVSGGTYVNADMHQVDGMWRCWLADAVGTTSAACTGFAATADADNSLSHAGTLGAGILVAGFQHEYQMVATSYVRVAAGSIVRRYEELVYLPNTVIPASLNEFAIAMDFVPLFPTDMLKYNLTSAEYFYVFEGYKTGDDRFGLTLRPLAGDTGDWAQDRYTAAGVWDGKNLNDYPRSYGDQVRIAWSQSATAVPTPGTSGQRLAIDGYVGQVSASATPSVAALTSMPDYIALASMTNLAGDTTAKRFASMCFRNITVYNRMLTERELATWEPLI